MKRKLKFIQENCTEGNKIDKRQSKLILKQKPDIILFELPQGKSTPNTIFNKYFPNKKPIDEVNKKIRKLELASKKYPYAKSDIALWNNIIKIWRSGKNISIYNIDAPNELRKEFNLFKKYPDCRNDLIFWVYVFIRESLYMKKNIEWVLSHHKEDNLKVAVFLQSFHWKNVKFLMTNPNKEEIWKYYFGRFKDVNPKNISFMIKLRSKILFKYWQKSSITKFWIK